MLPFVAKLRIILFVTKRYNFALGGKNSMKNKKRMASLLLAGCMAFSAVPVAFAADAEQAAVASDEEQKPTSGTCGEHVTWSLS